MGAHIAPIHADCETAAACPSVLLRNATKSERESSRCHGEFGVLDWLRPIMSRGEHCTVDLERPARDHGTEMRGIVLSRQNLIRFLELLALCGISQSGQLWQLKRARRVYIALFVEGSR
jgi:hypothetical protein